MNDKLTRIDMSITEEPDLELHTDDDGGTYFRIESLKATLPPHFSGKKLTGVEVLSFFVGVVGTVSVNILSNFIYDLVSKNKINKIVIDGKTVDLDRDAISSLLRKLCDEDSKTDD